MRASAPAPNRFLMCRNVVASARDFGCRQPLLSTVCPLKPLKPLVTLSVAFLMVVSTFLPTCWSESPRLAPTFANGPPVWLSALEDLGLRGVNLKPSVERLGGEFCPAAQGRLRPGVLPVRSGLLVALIGAQRIEGAERVGDAIPNNVQVHHLVRRAENAAFISIRAAARSGNLQQRWRPGEGQRVVDPLADRVDQIGGHLRRVERRDQPRRGGFPGGMLRS